MATSTKEALAAALRQMMTVKPIDKVTVKDIVEICGVNRQTFYYHFDDVDDLLEWVFEQDSDRVFPQEVVYNHWMEDMMNYFDYLVSNSAFTLNVYNSNSRVYMLRYLKTRMAACIRSFAEIARLIRTRSVVRDALRPRTVRPIGISFVSGSKASRSDILFRISHCA